MILQLLVVGLFGGLGAVLRNLLGTFKGYLPWGILIANTLATAISAWALITSPQLGLIVVAGLAGGLSTFSTFVGQTWTLLHERKRLAAFLNVSLNLVLPSTAVALVILCQ
jgi:CrcB protein